MGAVTGRVLRVNGPLVQVGGLPRIAMLDLVELGPERLPGEVMAIRGDVAAVQAYEYTGGLGPGAVARARGGGGGGSTGCPAPGRAPGGG